MELKRGEDSQCTGGIDSLYVLGEKHLKKWEDRDIKPICARCGIQLKLGVVVFTRRRPGRQVAPRCLPCADPLIDWDTFAFQTKEVRAQLRLYKRQKKDAKEMINVGGQEVTIDRGAPIIVRIVNGKPIVQTTEVAPVAPVPRIR